MEFPASDYDGCEFRFLGENSEMPSNVCEGVYVVNKFHKLGGRKN